jgi:hypothetical protein
MAGISEGIVGSSCEPTNFTGKILDKFVYLMFL